MYSSQSTRTDKGRPLSRRTARRARTNDVAADRAARLAAGCKPVVEALEDRRLLSGTVASLTLINADTDKPIGMLADGTTLNLATLPTRRLNVLATVSGDAESVRFGLDAKSNFRTENSDPYSLAGDKNGNYHAWRPSLGSHTLKVTRYSGNNAGGIATSS